MTEEDEQTPTPRGRTPKPTSDDYISQYKSGKKPIISYSAFVKKIKDFTKLIPDYTNELYFESGGRKVRATIEDEGGDSIHSFCFGRATEVDVDFEKIIERDLKDLVIPQKKPQRVLLDTGVLLACQVKPELIPNNLKDLLEAADLFYSPASIGQICEWLNGNEIIKDNIRRHDFIDHLIRGVMEVPITSKIKEDAMTLRGDFKGTMVEREIIACARNLNATVLSVREGIGGYGFVGNI